MCVSSVCTDVSPWYCSSLLPVCVCRQCVLMCHLGVALAGCLCVCRQCVQMCHLGIALAGCLCVCVVSVY